MVPPKAAPMAWCPRHTPRIGSLPAKARIAGTDTPASAGEQGPGDTTSRVTPASMRAPMSSSVSSSLRTVSTSAPSSPRYWTMLKVKES